MRVPSCGMCRRAGGARRASGLVTRVALAAIVLLGVGCPAGAQGLRYVQAYNALVSNLNARTSLVSYGTVRRLKNASVGETVKQSDLHELRSAVLSLMGSSFFRGPSFVDVEQSAFADAFPKAIGCMAVVGDGKGQWTKVPSSFTASGQAVCSAAFADAPLLWVHFQELDKAIRQLRYSYLPVGAINTWTNNGEMNHRNGWAYGSNWEQAKISAAAPYDAGCAWGDNNPPMAMTAGTGARPGFLCSADIHRRYAYHLVDHMPTNVSHALHFYLHTRIAIVGDDPTVPAAWDANGDDVGYNEWRYWFATGISRNEKEITPRFGGNQRPAWCNEPLSGGQADIRGYEVDTSFVMAEWVFNDVPLVRPPFDDVNDDGLSDRGCGCECPLQADPAWSGLSSDARVHWPLGLSSGTESGGQRVKAYLTEYAMNGYTQDVYSLRTGVTMTFENQAEGWAFVSVLRPTGPEVTYSLYGKRPGCAVEGSLPHRLTREGSEDFTLHFPSQAGEVFHRFWRSWVVEVGRKAGTNRVSTSWRGVRGCWPGLTTTYADWPVNAPVIRVDSPTVTAIPAYSDGLASSVEYHYKPAGPTNTCETYRGSKGYRLLDAQGQVLNDLRVVTDAARGSVEIWRGITTNNGVRVARKERREEWTEQESGLRMVRETVIANDGQPDAESNVTVSASQVFPWGEEVVSRIEGYGSPDARTTRWSYHTNAEDVANYGQVRMIEAPDGGWTSYEYDGAGRETRRCTGCGDSLPGDTSACRETELLYSGDSRLVELGAPDDAAGSDDCRPRLVVERLMGYETARTYHSYGAGWEETRRCAAAGARYDAPGALVTLTRFVTNGTSAGRLAAIDRPDGIRSVYAYAYTGGRLTTTEDTGTGTGAAVTNGTRRVTVMDSTERMESENVTDIASGVRLAGTVYTRDGYGRVVCASNLVDGAVTRTEYGCCGPEVVVDADGIVTRSDYDELKRPFAVERNGVTVYTRYNVGGAVTETRQSAEGVADRVSQSVYDKHGRVVRHVDERGSETLFAHATNAAGGRVVITTNPDGGVMVEDYFRDGGLRSVTGTAVRPVCHAYGADAQGAYTVTYRGVDTNAAEWVRTRNDLLGRAWRTEYPDGYVRETTYDSGGRAVSETDGFTTRLTEYDDLGRPVRVGIDMDGNGRLDMAGLDRVEEVATTHGAMEGRPAEHVVRRTFGTVDSDVGTTASEHWRSLDGTTSWAIEFGRTTRVEVVRQPASATRTETTMRPDGTRTVTTYTNGQPVSVEWRDATGGVVSVATSVYDAFGRVARVCDTAPDGTARTMAYAHDAGGLVTNEVVTAGASRRETRYTYDGMGRRARTVRPDGGVIQQTYELTGEPRQQWGACTYPVSYGYDEQGRLSELRTYRHGAGGPADVTQWRYDAARGWLTAKVYADGTTNAFEYARNGALARRTWARGLVTDYTYDGAGVLTNVAYSDGTPPVRRAYDRLGRLTVVADGLGVQSNRYAADGQVLEAAAPCSDVVTVHGYDGYGRRTGMVVRTTSGAVLGTVGYGYDAAGRMQSVASEAGTARYTFGPDGRAVTSLTVTRGKRDVFSGEWRHDGEGWLDAVSWRTNGTAWRSVAQEHDAGGRVKRREQENGRVWTYGYDMLGQLALATSSEPGLMATGAKAVTYTYDTIGNRTVATRDSGSNTYYTANGLNQYVALDYARASFGVIQGTVFTMGGAIDAAAEAMPAGTAVTWSRRPMLEAAHAAFSYDADGNLISDGTRAYAWDAENRLVSVTPLAPTSGAWRVRNGYDCSSRRAWRAADVWDGGAWVGVETNRYVYDGWRVVAETSEGVSGTTTNTYAWGLDLSGTLEGAGGIGGLLFGRFGGTGTPMTVAYAYDGAGNVIGLADPATGDTVAEYEYEPFGEVLTSRVRVATAEANRYRFSTKSEDPVTGLIYYGYRHYSPALGRWINRDPLEEEGGANLYGYAANNPLRFADALGLALYAFDGTWNDRDTMKRPTNVAKLAGVYDGLVAYRDGVGTDWYSKHIGGMTGAGGGNRIADMYADLVAIYNTPDPTGENQQIDVIGFSRGAALARTFVNYINQKGGVPLTGPDGKPTGVVCPVTIRFLGVFDTVASFGWPGNNVNWGQDLSIPPNVKTVRHATALDEKRGMFPLSSVLGDPNNPLADPRIVEQGFRGAHSDIGGGYEDGDRSNFALIWMHAEGVRAGVPFGPLPSGDIGASNPIIHDERSWWERYWDRPRTIYYMKPGG